MQLYLDTSALVKLVVLEAESAALRELLDAFPADTRFASALARTELVRAISRQGPPDSIAHARRVLGRLDLIPLTNRLLDSAASLAPPELRTLDAIHLSSALTAPELRAMITYDGRLAQAATDSGINVLAPT